MPKSFQCPVCEVDLPSKRQFKKHVLVHPEYKAFACTQCDRRFRHEASLSKHAKQCTGRVDAACTQAPADQLADLRWIGGEVAPALDDFEVALDRGVDHMLAKQVTLHCITNKTRALVAHLHDKPKHLALVVGLIKQLQSSSTKERFQGLLLRCLDPHEMVGLRNRIIGLLSQEQKKLDRELLECKCKPSPDLGHRLRCFIEAALRFENIPCRVQCTVDMVGPAYEKRDYVAKLVGEPGHPYQRVILFDKVFESHQPLSIPVGEDLSVYLAYYDRRIRPPGSECFFVNEGERNPKRPVDATVLARRSSLWRRISPVSML